MVKRVIKAYRSRVHNELQPPESLVCLVLLVRDTKDLSAQRNCKFLKQDILSPFSTFTMFSSNDKAHRTVTSGSGGSPTRVEMPLAVTSWSRRVLPRVVGRGRKKILQGIWNLDARVF